MSRKEGGDPAASELAAKKWRKAGPKKTTAHAKMMAKKRWEGHIAKRPASSRKKKAGKNNG